MFVVCCSPQTGKGEFFLVNVVKHSNPHLVSGLVKEDVARLRVLGDFRSESIEFFYGLRIDFLQNQKEDTVMVARVPSEKTKIHYE